MNSRYLMSALVVAATVASGVAIAKAPPEWTHCAGNGAVCDNHGPAMFRYGYDNNWSEIEGRGSLDCVPQNFVGGAVTGDPFGPGLPDVDKRCERMKP